MAGHPGTPRAPRLWLACVSALLIILQQVGGKAARDALFLSLYPAADLPKVAIFSALLAIVAVLSLSRLLVRFGPARVVPGAFILTALLFATEWLLYSRAPGLVALLLYVHVATFGALVISAFWSVVSEVFDPHSAKFAVSRIAAAGTAGGLAGGLIAERFGAWASVPALLPVLAIVNLSCAAGVALLSRHGVNSDPEPAERPWGNVARSPYLRSLALLVTCTAVVSAMADYVLKAQAAAELTTGAQLIGFFAAFYTVTSLATFVVQTLLTRPTLQRIGLGGTLAGLPAMMILTGAVGLTTMRLWTATLVRGAETVLANSFFRSSYELLYTPLPAEQKRSTKSIIDVACDRAGDILGSGLVLGLLAITPAGISNRAVLFAAVLAAVVGVALSIRLHHGYVSELATSLRQGLVTIREADDLDQTTRLTLSQTLSAVDRDQLLAQIRDLRASQSLSFNAARAMNWAGKQHDQLRAWIDELTGSDPAQLRSALARRPLDARASPILIELLGHPDQRVVEAAVDALKELAPRIVGQLIDCLLDDEQPIVVRRRIPRVLRVCTTARAVRGLGDALFDASFSIRYRAAKALLGICEQSSELRPPKNLLFAAAEQELTRSTPEADWVGERDEFTTATVATDPRLDQVFVLLSLALDRDSIQMARRALDHGDAKLRGTALEYLDNVVPERVHDLLLAALNQTRARSERRKQDEVLAELRRSMAVTPAKTPR